ncbi:Uncharacterised protein [Actinomyces bovis]|uniref:FHA domain-containing protein n=1 Tax=Actinomyces bovis TaxID=1658 RepID=A0ABY1VLG9_9ACTO|nr:hypothetical protein [Actinomyces bovis]SPT52954.1 Uncharacterised protein [Actinomyces bovis]VEG55147.1 Uncharacterised protein [Actinomyces israelii]
MSEIPSQTGTPAEQADEVGQAAPLVVDFCGEVYRVQPGEVFRVGREGDLAIDDNPFLHRRFLVLEHAHGLWWLSNVGSRLAASVAESTGSSVSHVAPGSRVPLVFPAMTIVFSAGATTYEILLKVPCPAYDANMAANGSTDMETTIGAVNLTASQHLLILALAEPWLRRVGSGPVDLPRNVDAAARLGWSLTRFNRKLDNVCDKLDRVGIKGLRGGPQAHASFRRVALVDYALAARLVTAEDLPLLDASAAASKENK